MNKVIHISSLKKTGYKISQTQEENSDITNKKISNEKIKHEKKSYLDLLNKLTISTNISTIYDNYDTQLLLIQNLYKDISCSEHKYVIRALKIKLDSYKQQDIKKTYNEYNDFITLENIVEKLVKSSMLCFYCNVKTLILFKNSREEYQWTLDRINNYDEHSNNNTIICCLKCNLQRRRKNSEKFKFSKQLEKNLIILKKME